MKYRCCVVNFSILSMDSSAVVPIRIIENSSPPFLHKIEFPGKLASILCATVFSASSPTSCPYISLMNLKSSISIWIPTQFTFECSFMILSSCSSKPFLFKRPVSGSVMDIFFKCFRRFSITSRAHVNPVRSMTTQSPMDNSRTR